MKKQTEFDEIFRAYYSQLLIYALQMIDDEEECHDIVNSAYEYVWAHFAEVKRTTVKALLYTSVKNKCIDYLRHRDTHNLYVEFCLKQAEEEKPEEEEAEWETDYRIACIRELMRTLNPTTRYVLEACYVDKKKYKEVAGELGISMSTVKKHLTKAPQLFRERLLKNSAPVPVSGTLYVLRIKRVQIVWTKTSIWQTKHDGTYWKSCPKADRKTKRKQRSFCRITAT